MISILLKTTLQQLVRNGFEQGVSAEELVRNGFEWGVSAEE